MKKTLSILLVAAVSLSAVFAAPKKSAIPEAPEITAPVELKYGDDWTIDTTWFGEEYFTIDGKSVHYNPGSKNNNHAVMFKLARRGTLAKNSVLEIEYKMDKYDPSKSCQLVIQPATMEGTGSADYGMQNYPILYNNFEPAETGVLTVDCDRLLKSSVKKVLDGFRMINNEGSYEKFKWQSDWGFTITKVTMKPKTK
ncbi:MAG: hypothetical protein IJ688_02230 [Treponema sp.]|nr:hypothetical protein [Treponema sp.]